MIDDTVDGVAGKWVRGDMRSFDLRRQFRTIFVASNSFSHLYSGGDIKACLSAIRRHLVVSAGQGHRRVMHSLRRSPRE